MHMTTDYRRNSNGHQGHLVAARHNEDIAQEKWRQESTDLIEQVYKARCGTAQMRCCRLNYESIRQGTVHESTNTEDRACNEEHIRIGCTSKQDQSRTK